MRKLGLAIVLVSFSSSAPASAAVRVGEVSGPPLVRATANEAVAKLDVRKNAIVSLSSRCERQPSGVTCVVSAALRGDQGNLFAIVEGRARAVGSASDSAESAALKTAVQGAIARIPDALR